MERGTGVGGRKTKSAGETKLTKKNFFFPVASFRTVYSHHLSRSKKPFNPSKQIGFFFFVVSLATNGIIFVKAALHTDSEYY